MDDYEVVAFGSPPASAGSTWRASMSTSSVWRSPPRARGAPYAGRHGRTYLAITPASAGSTGPLCPRRTSTKDHPRERGEHTRWRAPRVGRDHLRERGEHAWFLTGSTRWSGSPPRARGAHFLTGRYAP